MLDLAKLKELAEKATQKPWNYYDQHGTHQISTVEPGHETFQDRIAEMVSPAFRLEQTGHDGRFIAAANPKAVLALIKAYEELQSSVTYLIDRCEGNHPDGWIRSVKTYGKFKASRAKSERILREGLGK